MKGGRTEVIMHSVKAES